MYFSNKAELQGIRVCKNQTEELCLEAIKYNYKALEYVKEQTEYLCLEAIKKIVMHLSMYEIKQKGLL